MTGTEIFEYKKAYVELYEIIKLLSKEEKEKIPDIFIKNLKKDMDKDYHFTIDKSKNILEQNFKVETKALLVELYEKYLAPEEEKEFWNNYDRICLNMIEKEKNNRYNSNNIFKKKNENSISNNEIDNNSLPIKIKNENNVFRKFIKILKRIFYIS